MSRRQAVIPGTEQARPRKTKKRAPQAPSEPCGIYRIARAGALANFRGKAPWPDANGEVLLGLYILCYSDAYGTPPQQLYGQGAAEDARMKLTVLARRAAEALNRRDRDGRPGYVRYLRWAFVYEKQQRAQDPDRRPLGHLALTSNAMLERWRASEERST